jgi:DNA alkylation repair enzyme
MPAVDIARLRIQSARVTDHFGDPPALLRELHDMFELYADRTRRPGQLASPVTVLPSYHIPVPALRQLENDLGFQAENRPEETVALAEALWRDGYLESRLLAAYLLGRTRPGGEEFLERLTDWVSHTREPNVRRTLLTTSLGRLRRENQPDFLRLVRRWVHPTYDRMWSRAIEALLPVLADPEFHNLPVVFDLVKPIVNSGPPVMQNEIAELITALYEASPTETTVYLRQVALGSGHPQTRVTLRRILSRLPEGLQEDLSQQLRRSS